MNPPRHAPQVGALTTQPASSKTCDSPSSMLCRQIVGVAGTTMVRILTLWPLIIFAAMRRSSIRPFVQLRYTPDPSATRHTD